MSETHFEVLIIGGGTAGITTAAQLLNVDSPPQVAIIDPAPVHYYQPIWTLVGGGVVPREVSKRSMESVIPDGATWIREHALEFDPANNTVVTKEGSKITYDYLVVAAGIQIDWDKIDGLKGNLGRNGVCSNYSYESVDSTWDSIRGFQGGNAVFTFPVGPFKCAGAPQKIMWLAEESFRRQGVRSRTNVIYMCAGGAIFGIPKYRDALAKLAAQRDIDDRYKEELVGIRAESKEAVFIHVDSKEESVVKYDMLHITPPQSAPDFLKRSPLAGSDPKGWIDVDKFSLQHTRHSNVFSLGDCSSLPCSKTGAAIRKQAPVVVDNLLALRRRRPLSARYDGYASCPLVTGYGKVILAEFGYDGVIMETFPFNQARERYSMYALKAHALPQLYWHGMLRGRL